MENEGYEVLGQLQNNSGHGIDIIARRGDTIAFVEVKTSGTPYAPGLTPDQVSAIDFIESRLLRAINQEGHFKQVSDEVNRLATEALDHLRSGGDVESLLVEITHAQRPNEALRALNWRD